MQPRAVVLDPVQPALVARGRQAGDGRHHHVGQHPAGLAELQERLADHVVDGDRRLRRGPGSMKPRIVVSTLSASTTLIWIRAM